MIDLHLPKPGEKSYLMHKEVIVTNVYSLFGLVKVRYPEEIEEFYIDVCALSNTPDYTDSISLKMLGGNCCG